MARRKEIWLDGIEDSHDCICFWLAKCRRAHQQLMVSATACKGGFILCVSSMMPVATQKA